MKYIVVKGWLGFGDRLESLKMAIHYALQYNLQIYVDWTDSMWSHGDESFYTYFDLVNMPTLKSLSEIPSDATIYPPAWKDKLHNPCTLEMIKEGGIKIDFISKPVDADVMVLTCIGARYLYEDSTFFANVFRVIDSRIADKVRERQTKYNLASCIGVHIRGTDRIRNEIQRATKIQFLAVNAGMQSGFGQKPMICVTDDKNSFQIWKNFFPQCHLLSEKSVEISASKGNHNVSKSDLKLSKDELNVELLIDFFTLVSCQKIITTYPDSRFAKEAARLHHFINVFF